MNDEIVGGKIWVEIKVEYQNIPLTCNLCNVFGHASVKCPKATRKWVPKASDASMNNASTSKSATPGASAACSASSGFLPVSKLGVDGSGILAPSVSSPVEEWTTVNRAKGSPRDPILDKPPCKSGIPISNSFMLISDSSDSFPSSTYLSPVYKPLVAKLKSIDENEVDRGKCDAISPSASGFPPSSFGTPIHVPSEVLPYSPSSTDVTPSPNPLVSKLKLIDEIAGKDSKNNTITAGDLPIKPFSSFNA